MKFVGRFNCNVIGRYLSFNQLVTKSQVRLIPPWLLAFTIRRNARFQLGVIQVEMMFFLRNSYTQPANMVIPPADPEVRNPQVRTSGH